MTWVLYAEEPDRLRIFVWVGGCIEEIAYGFVLRDLKQSNKVLLLSVEGTIDLEEGWGC